MHMEAHIKRNAQKHEALHLRQRVKLKLQFIP